MIFDAHLYGDPCLVLQRKQDAAINRDTKRIKKCGKCESYQSIVIGCEVHHGCIRKQRNWQACTFFEKMKV